MTKKKTVSIPSLSPSVSSSLQETLELVTKSSRSYRSGRRKNKGNVVSHIEVEKPVEILESFATPTVKGETEIVEEALTETTSSPFEEVSDKKVRTKIKKKKKKKKNVEVKDDVKPTPLPISSFPGVERINDGSMTTEKTVSLKPKEEVPTITSLPEEMSIVPVCPPPEEMVPVQTSGIFIDSTKLITPLKTEMIVGSPLKLVTSQYIEQPFVQTVMPVQMPVTYQIPIVKLSQTSGMFFPQIPNYIIPPSPPMFPTSPVPAFRNGFHFSTTGTIQFQSSSTTLQQTSSGFMQSTNSSGFQIVQSPAANIQQSVLTAFQNSGIANLNLKSPTLRLLNCQPLILNNAKPLTNVSMTLTNVSSVSNPNGSSLTVPTIGLPVESNKAGRKIISSTPGTVPVSPATTPKKLVKQKLNILPKPNVSQKSGIANGTKSKKQCLQPCGPATGAAT